MGRLMKICLVEHIYAFKKDQLNFKNVQITLETNINPLFANAPLLKSESNNYHGRLLLEN